METRTDPTTTRAGHVQAPGQPGGSGAATPWDRWERWLGGYAVLAAVGACVVSPLLGLAYFRTADGREELETGSVSWWAEPATEWLGPLLTWAGPDRVYATYVQVMAVFFPAVLLCALHARRRRTVRTRAERTGWGTSLVGYALGCVGVLVVAVLLAVTPHGAAVLDVAFLALMVPGMLLSMIGSTTLGVSLLRGGWQPRATAWLLAVALPFWFAASFLLGHNSLGELALFLAWAAYGRRLMTRGATLSS